MMLCLFGTGPGGIYRISGVDVQGGGEGDFQRVAEVRQAFLISCRLTVSFRPVFLIFTTGGLGLRNIRVKIVGDNYQEKP